MKKKNQHSRAMEFLWITIAVLSLTVGVSQNLKSGFEESYFFYIFTIVSVLMYLWRRKLRINSQS